MLELSGANILITGGAGFIGSHLADSLLRLGCKVTVLDNFDDFYSGKEENVKHNLGNSKYRLIKADIRDQAAVDSACKGIDVIFHLAAQAGIRYCNLDPVKTNSVNVDGTINVLNSARKHGVKKLVYASSSSVFGKIVKVPIDENHPTNPTSVYGASKLSAEKYCLAYFESYGLQVTCLRYFSVYGPRGRPDQVIHAFVKNILGGQSPIIYGDGSHSRDFTFVSDVVSATILSAMREESSGRVFNIGYGKEYRIIDVAEMILDALNSNKPPAFKEGYQGDFPRTLCNNRKAQELLGWKAQVPLREGISYFIEWYKLNRREVYQKVN
ncbi:MAG: SDR family NAD(P)-dependent oxidoreductase [Conexivisphaerales archaeon]